MPEGHDEIARTQNRLRVPNLQEGSIELRNAHTNLMNIALVLCLAHVTNTMGQAGDDFEKGDADGTRDALAVLAHLINVFRAVS
jgi:hypothetical protein